MDNKLSFFFPIVKVEFEGINFYHLKKKKKKILVKQAIMGWKIKCQPHHRISTFLWHTPYAIERT